MWPGSDHTERAVNTQLQVRGGVQPEGPSGPMTTESHSPVVCGALSASQALGAAPAIANPSKCARGTFQCQKDILRATAEAQQGTTIRQISGFVPQRSTALGQQLEIRGCELRMAATCIAGAPPPFPQTAPPRAQTSKPFYPESSTLLDSLTLGRMS